MTNHHERLGRLLCLAIIMGGCAARTEVTSIDLTQREGAFVVAYTADRETRQAMEQQLVADLAQRGMIGYPSQAAVPDIIAATPADMLRAARKKAAATIIIINQVASDGSGNVVKSPRRVSPLHPDLQAFHEYSRAHQGDAYDPDREAIVEVNLFLIMDDRAQLFWSGTTWAFDADGAGGAIGTISTQIADALAEVRSQIRGE